MKTRTRIAKAAAAIAVATTMVLLTSCSMPVQVPVQTQQQQQNTQTFIDQLRKLVQPQNQASKPSAGEEVVADLRAPQTYPQVVWPAPGAGDFAQVQPQWLVGPVKDIRAPAPVVGINPNIVIPELLPSVVWPETAASQPTYWHTVGVDERELLPPVMAPASIKAGEDLLDRHPAPVVIQKAGEDLLDRHPAPVVIQKAGEDLLDRHPAPVVIQKAGEDLLDRHPANVFPLAPRAVPPGIRPESLEPAGKTDLIPVPGPADDCPIRPTAGPC
jgi:hypothetical protein